MGQTRAHERQPPTTLSCDRSRPARNHLPLGRGCAAPGYEWFQFLPTNLSVAAGPCLYHPFGMTAHVKPAIRPSEPRDIDDLLRLIRGIAEYENLAHQLEATADLENLLGKT